MSRRMPKPTFFNLPAPKRERIVDRALEEFAERPYHLASLSRIVTRAGIAKGSLYQYFDDKFDLYRWLLTEELPRRKAAFVEARGESEAPASLAGFLRQLVLSGLDFMRAHPRWAQLASTVTAPTDDPALRALSREVEAEGIRRFLAILQRLREQGQLRDDLDLDLIAHVLRMTLGSGLPSILRGRLGVELAELGSHRDEVAQLVEDLSTLVVEGVGARPRL